VRPLATPRGEAAAPDAGRAARRRGRPPSSVAEQDADVHAALDEGKYRTYEELAADLGWTTEMVRQAIDRHRKRCNSRRRRNKAV
jgi:hypothetical protein